MQEIATGIFVENRYAPYNLGVVTLVDGTVLAVDAPPDPNRSQAWRTRIESQIGSLRYLVLSDVSAEKLVSAALWRDVPLVLSKEAETILSGLIENGWRELAQRVIALPASGAFAPPSPTMVFDRDMRFHHRSHPVLLSQGPGVLPGALTLFDTRSGILFAGDTVAITQPSPALAVADYKVWLTYLDDLSKHTEVRRIIPGRGKAPIFRAELEQQRELMYILQRTARKLVRNSTQLGPRARDLGQIFFNRAGNQAAKCLRLALEHLLAELILPESTPMVTTAESQQEEKILNA